MKKQVVLFVLVLGLLGLGNAYAQSQFGKMSGNTIKSGVQMPAAGKATYNDAVSSSDIEHFSDLQIISAQIVLFKWNGYIDLTRYGVKAGDKVYELALRSSNGPAIRILFKSKDRAMALFYQDGIMNKGTSFSITGDFAAVQTTDGNSPYYVFDDEGTSDVSIGFRK
ncbi:MAG: hypothetical protein HYW47_00885 [Deltaproteobacteria bacterium]|nr:hypothetical protein [Deltaproteobacteria bacterium]